MKNSFTVLLLVFVLLILNSSLVINNCYSQWQPDVRLTNDPANSFTSRNNAWNVASSGDTVHVVWRDQREANDEIYYKRSIDAGTNWGADTRLTNATGISAYPSVSVSGPVVHVAWRDNRDGNDEIYYKRSTDGGINWSTDTRLTNATGISAYPSMSVSGSVVNVVWQDNRDGNDEIYCKRSTDGGINWSTDTRLTNATGTSLYPSISLSGSAVNVVWQDNRDGNDEIYCKCSTDGGLSWGTDIRLTNNTANSRDPSLSVSGSVVHVVWDDNRDGNGEIYYKRSSDGGLNWGTDTRLTNNTGNSMVPSIAVNGSIIHVVYFDNDQVSYTDLHYKRSTNNGTGWEADIQLTSSNLLGSDSPKISVSGSTLHVIWDDNLDGNFEIYYKRNPTGNLVGITKIISEIPSSYSLQQNYPNPFNPVTKIQYAIPKNGFVKLIIFDAIGREVETLVNESQNAGIYEVTFDAAKYPSGVYFYRIITKDFVQTQKMVLIK